MPETYPPPVDQLFSLGEPEPRVRDWPDYRALGLADEHVPVLLALLEDPRLSWVEWSEGDDQAPHWAPMHAWRALGQLAAPAAAEALTRVLMRDDDDDRAASEIPGVLAMIGPTAWSRSGRRYPWRRGARSRTRREAWARRWCRSPEPIQRRVTRP